MRSKDFGSPVVSDEPVTFTVYDSVFKCVPALQGRSLIKFIQMADNDDAGSSAASLLEFLDNVLVPADKERFKAMCTSATHVVPLETLSEITTWLVEQYTGRPTQPSSDSSVGD
jgi:hypothetical protein